MIMGVQLPVDIYLSLNLPFSKTKKNCFCLFSLVHGGLTPPPCHLQNLQELKFITVTIHSPS